MDIRVSVVIPLYNKASHIVGTIESVIKQSYAPYEILVVDDGSADGSAELVESHFGDRVRLIRQENQGVSAARNTGIALAESPYVAFLDADDAWYTNHIATLVDLIAQFPNQGLYSTSYEVMQGSRLAIPTVYYPDQEAFVVRDFYAAMAFNLALVHSSSACASAECLRAIGGFPLGVTRGEDLIVWITLATDYGIAHSNRRTAVYNKNAENRASSIAVVQLPESLLFLAKRYQDNAFSTDRKGIGMLFDAIAFYTAAGLKSESATVSMRSFIDAAWSLGRFKLWLLMLVIQIVPPTFLNALKKYRYVLSPFRRVS